MKFLLLTFVLSPLLIFSQLPGEISFWKKQAADITIVRDNWGVPHIYAKTDAGCAFGLMYAQCEDNYWQIEESFIGSLGRSGELYGERSLEGDAAVALFECLKKGKQLYLTADPLVKELCDAAAAGMNYFLYTHPSVEKRLLLRYEPWHFLVPSPASPTSHGIPRSELKNNFACVSPGEEYDNYLQQKETGSNTMALAPSKSVSGKSMLLINPHVSFFGGGQRYEAHLVSKQGLNVSGFAMLGDFYIWSGFTKYAGWSHTNTSSDYEDVYLEHYSASDPSLYKYGNEYRKETKWYDTLLYKDGNELKKKIFVFRKTHHGPVVAQHDTLFVTVKNAAADPEKYILQCWRMCRAKNLEQFTKAMNMVQLTTNTSYADIHGNIAYWHGNAIPRRDTAFDWRSPVDGSNPATEWKGMHTADEIIHVVNPVTGWLQNCNTSPYESAGAGSPAKKYPLYMSYETENFRSEEAKRLLSTPGKISYDEFQKLAVSNHLPMMEYWMPAVVAAYDRKVKEQPDLANQLKDIADTLRHWDHRYSLNSKATTLGVAFYYAYNDWLRQQRTSARRSAVVFSKTFPASDDVAVQLLKNAADDLSKTYGSVFIPWGDLNRLQRIHSSGTLEKFDDGKPSLAVPSVPSALGSLFAFNTRTDAGQKKLYGISGNTYVAVVEFGKKIRARSIVYFGQSADPSSPHYFDQAPIYASGKFKDAWFYRKDVMKHAERVYRPGTIDN